MESAFGVEHPDSVSKGLPSAFKANPAKYAGTIRAQANMQGKDAAEIWSRQLKRTPMKGKHPSVAARLKEQTLSTSNRVHNDAGGKMRVLRARNA